MKKKKQKRIFWAAFLLKSKLKNDYDSVAPYGIEYQYEGNTLMFEKYGLGDVYIEIWENSARKTILNT